MLIAFGGLPGTGKTTVARNLACRLEAVYLRIDSIEQQLVRSGIGMDEMGPAGYMVGYALAADNLRLGLIVVADSVNSLGITRAAWKSVAREAGVRLLEVELRCSDRNEHRSRIESRRADIPGHALPGWNDVLDRHYEPWESVDITIDTSAVSAEQAVETIARGLACSARGTPEPERAEESGS